MTRHSCTAVLLVALGLSAGALASAGVVPRPAMAPGTILYGAAYYHE